MAKAPRHRSIVLAALVSACHPSPPPPPAISAPATAAPARPPIVGRAALLLDIERSDPTSDIAWSPDGKTFAVEEPHHRIGLWDVTTGARRMTIETPGDVLALGFRRDGRAVWAVTDHGAGAWDIATGVTIHAASVTSTKEERHAAWSPSGELLAIISEDARLRVVREGSAVIFESAIDQGAAIESWSASSDLLVTRAGDRRTIWDAATGARRGDLRPRKGWTTHLGPDARTTLSISADENELELADAITGAKRASHQLEGTVRFVSPQQMPGDATETPVPAQVLDFVWSPDGATIAVACDVPKATYGPHLRHAKVALYDTATGKLRHALRETFVAQSLLAFGPDGSQLFTWRDDSRRTIVEAWDARTGARVGARRKEIVSLKELGAKAWSPAGDWVAILPEGRRGEIAVIDGKSGSPRFTVPILDGSTWDILGDSDRTASMDPSSLRIAVGGKFAGVRDAAADHAFALWNPRADRVRTLGAERSGPIASLPQWLGSLTPEDPSTDAASVAYDDAWLARFEILSGWRHAVASHHRTMAFATDKKSVVVWSGEGKGSLFTLEARSRPSFLAFTPDGALLIVKNDGDAFHVFDMSTRKEISHFGDGSGTSAVRADGSFLAGNDGQLHIYEPRTGNEIATLPFLKDAFGVWSPDGALFFDTREGILWDAAAGRARSTLGRAEQAVFSPRSDEIATLHQGAVTISRTSDGRSERRIRVPMGTYLAGFSEDGRYLGLGTRTGARLLRLGDGASLHLHLVHEGKGSFSRVIALDSGHFDADAATLDHVRLWTEEGVVAGGPVRDRFARPGVKLDFFGP